MQNTNILDVIYIRDMGYIIPKQITPNPEIGKMAECVINAFASHKEHIRKLLKNEKEGNNNKIVISKYEEVLLRLDSLCDSLVRYIHKQFGNFDHDLLYHRAVVSHVLKSYLQQIESSMEVIMDIFPLKIQEGNPYRKEIERIKRLISIIEDKTY